MGRAGLEVSAENTSQAQENTALSSTSTTTIQQERVQNVVQILQKHPELMQVLEVWETLPAADRKEIISVIEVKSLDESQ